MQEGETRESPNVLLSSLTRGVSTAGIIAANDFF